MAKCGYTFRVRRYLSIFAVLMTTELLYLTFYTSSLLNLESIWYYALVLLFGLFIVWAASSDHDCVRVGGEKAGELERSVSINHLCSSPNLSIYTHLSFPFMHTSCLWMPSHCHGIPFQQSDMAQLIRH